MSEQISGHYVIHLAFIRGWRRSEREWVHDSFGTARRATHRWNGPWEVINPHGDRTEYPRFVDAVLALGFASADTGLETGK